MKFAKAYKKMTLFKNQTKAYTKLFAIIKNKHLTNSTIQFKTQFIVIFLSLFILLSCSSDDDNSGTQNTTSTVEFEVILTENGEFGPNAILTTQINNTSNQNPVSSFPFSRTYTEVDATEGTFLILNYEDDSSCAPEVNCDYTIRMRIYVDEEVVAEQFTTLAANISSASTTYTF